MSIDKFLDYTGLLSVTGPGEFGKKSITFGHPYTNPSIKTDTSLKFYGSNREFQKYLERRFGVDILKVPHYSLNKYGDVAGRREGNIAYVGADFDPVTERAVMAHEALPCKTHEQLQRDVEALFIDLRDPRALERTIEIGKKMGWRR
jgi:hypothetical protein